MQRSPSVVAGWYVWNTKSIDDDDSAAIKNHG